jgi:hypothetical protein
MRLDFAAKYKYYCSLVIAAEPKYDSDGNGLLDAKHVSDSTF